MVRTLRNPDRSRRTSLLGFLLVVLFIWGQGYSMVHHSLVEHHACDDGQLAHGDHHHQGHADEADRTDDPVHVADAADEGDEHGDHCRVPTVRDQRRVLPPVCSLIVEAPRPVQLIEEQRAPEARAGPVFRLAPKQSPPQVG